MTGLERSPFTRLCKADTIGEGGMRLVIVDAHLILLAWPDQGELRAFQGVCPQANTPLAEAEFDGRVLAWPNHNSTWDLTTGALLHPLESAMAEYSMKIEDGIVYIDTEGVSPLFAQP